MTFIKKINTIQTNKDSLICIGLDTDISKIPSFLNKSKNPPLEFNKKIIKATKDLVCAYKLNLAFYEASGKNYYDTIHKTLEQIPSNIITIADGKRGDIGNTAEQYAKIIIEDWKFDAATVNPYMGYDSIEPFIRSEKHGAFLLALTSNAGSKDFQYLNVKGRPLYEHVIAKAIKWNKLKNIGIVVGATHPSELKRIRSMAPDMPLLIPGVGTQQGDIESTIRYGCDKNGKLALINISRAIIYNSIKKDFAEKARKATLDFMKQFNQYRK